ncbi:MAG TPA: hypothetical protein PK752_23895 [Accumulibacter sp.]|nr:hypothetical protein [Accumulibacter sp.]
MGVAVLAMNGILCQRRRLPVGRQHFAISGPGWRNPLQPVAGQNGSIASGFAAAHPASGRSIINPGKTGVPT